jgi:SAM-dependent methyltransferase
MFSDASDLNRKLRDIEYLGILKTLQKAQSRNLGTIVNHLDFGGGLGGLVRYLRAKGFKSILFEEGFSAEVAIDNNIPITLNPDEDFYDCITAIEVLEHLIEPATAVETMARALRSSGVLLITTGNLSKHKGSIAEWYYARTNPDVHITFFTPKALSRLLEKFGFAQINLKFDSHIILYKVLKNIFMLPFIKDKNLIKKTIWIFRVILIPFMPIVDWIFGVSEQGLYVKQESQTKI